MSRILVIVYLAEVGLFLVVTPWTQFWDRNYFVESLPMFEPALRSPALRGSVSGFGLVSLATALVEVVGLVRRRWLRHGIGGRGSSVPARVDIPPPDLREEVVPPRS